jgi:predicted GNAT family acetyltransferase|tara:strand:+ start:68 stop:295 length:228 start_codon:yes stop_codon:yes gene_type:complete
MTDKTIKIDGDVVYLKSLKDIDKGEYFKRKPESKTIYTKGNYDRSEKKYQCDNENDISKCIYLKGDTVVSVGFTY